VTVVTAELEGLGDLKLYRIPIPVTVAANAQKQVALLHMERVRFRRLYSASVSVGYEQDEEDGPDQARILLRTKNVEALGLGKPLPSGTLAMFEEAGGRPMMVGESLIYDTPVGQDVEIEVGRSPDVLISYGPMPRKPKDEKRRDSDERIGRHAIQVSNATSAPVDVEISLSLDDEDYRLVKPSRKLGRKNGRPLWRAHVPANGTARLTYTINRRPPRDLDDEDE
jgi:hypothetical protein